MKKKLLCVGLIIALVLSFSACGATTSSSSGPVENEDGSVNTKAFQGAYEDTSGTDADLTVLAGSSEKLYITVCVEDGDETQTWNMTAKYDTELDKLVYSNCSYMIEEGKSTETKYQDGSGSFEWDDAGILKWTGASDIQCQSMVFERTEQ